MNTNFVEWIEEEAAGEKIEAVVISGNRYDEDGRPVSNDNTSIIEDVLLTWEEVRDDLDYKFNPNQYNIQCHAIYAWTASKVIFISQYDGSTEIYSIPRNPVDCKPEMPGGG